MGLVAGVLEYESISRVTRTCLYLFIVSIFCVAILAGGRSPIMVLLLFIGISSYTRTRIGKPWMPNSRILRVSAGLLLLTFMVYSTVIWSVRAAESSRTPEQALHYAAEIGGAQPKPYLVAVSAWLNSPGFTLSALNSFFYLTQTIQVTEKILGRVDNSFFERLRPAACPRDPEILLHAQAYCTELDRTGSREQVAGRRDLNCQQALASHQSIPMMYGSYHIDLIAAALRLFPAGRALLKENNAILVNAKIYGYFEGSWGGLFLDFGCFSLLAAMLWGFFAGAAWVKFKNNPGVLTGIFYVFWTYSILIGFASAPFGFSNSFVIFGWFLIFALCATKCCHDD